jgi:hypothetical protein
MVHDQPSALFEAIALLLVWPLPHHDGEHDTALLAGFRLVGHDLPAERVVVPLR